MSREVFAVVFLLGAVQGLILALYLFFSRNDKRQAKYFLGALILALSYDMFETALSAQRIRLFTTDLFAYSLWFTLGPSLYFAIKTSLNPDRIPGRTIFLHYVPALTDFVISAFIFALRFKEFFGVNLPLETFIAINRTHLISTRLLMVVVFWIYFVFAFREYRRFGRSTAAAATASSQIENAIVRKWLRSFLYVCFFIAVVWTATIFGLVFFRQERVLYFYYPLELLLAVLVYWIGFTSYHRIKIVYLNEQKNTQQHLSKLTSPEIDDAVAALTRAMTVEKLYVDPELTLPKLAAHLGLPPKTVSAVLNQHLKVGFNTYVNSFRVEEVKERLSDARNHSSTILSVALDSGFNSLATFQRVFKSLTGMTPKQFLAKQRRTS
jgi:AraC-like DNA-binding protein